MQFNQLHPDYQNYESKKYFMSEIPREFLDAFQGLIVATVHNRDNAVQLLKLACNIVAKYIPTKPTQNWGWDYLLRDLEDYLYELHSKNKFHKFMDCIAEIANSIDIDLKELNELLLDHDIGYELDFKLYDGAWWSVVDENMQNRSESIEEALECVNEDYINVIEHLNQAKEQLSKTENSRARKDALRDCASAMESYLEYLSGENDIKEAVKKLRDEYDLPRKIISDATSIWDRIHQQHPDVRHGSAINTDLSEAEALYWIDRIMALIKYLSRTIEK
ncbi:hypothetical protein [Geobacillus sp. PK12]|jgi:hypothetical protein|uniref:hypothetical protein n=1 Tax=Geobacillus sp. PK12 TaxID=2508525 RepID=UPI001010801F|nr:hypothetical protein [Geobacillus sp. PK12]RXS89091.1 hypothetical protein ETR37_07700 [Geobacillus sp. PK12]